MNELKQFEDHHAFIISTDRKSLYTQIKRLVHQAQDVASKELNQRRQALKLLLDYEDKIYEEEFANKVKSRIDEDIKERKDILLKIKEENKKHELKFLKTKRIQQYMNSCYEIREALRRKEMQDVKKCQLEQMLENERTVKKEKDLDKYWHKVQETNLRVLNERQQEEECLKQRLVKYHTYIQRVQQEELQERRELERQEKLEEKQKLNVLLEEIRLEEFERKMQVQQPKVVAYRDELKKMIQEKQNSMDKERHEEADRHRQMMAEIKRLEDEEKLVAKEKKKAFHQATLDFIRYCQAMRQFEQDQQQRFNDRIDDLRHVDICTKSNISRERQRKARIAEQCYADLRKQICEQYERRLREEAQHKECKILENRFARQEQSRAEILAQRQKHRKDLDKQIEELRKVRSAEEEKFAKHITLASNNPEFCAQLAAEYIKEGIDYLEPHANWHLFARKDREYVAKPPAQSLTELIGHGAVPKQTCCCIGQSGHKITDGRGDEFF